MQDGKVVVGILGCGVVGGALVRLIQERPIEDCLIRAIVVSNPDPTGKHSFVEDKGLLTSNWKTVTGDSSVDIVVEAIGGPVGVPAQHLSEALLRAINEGKSLVTANKAFVGENWSQIARAQRKGISLGIEACVGGSIPIIEPLRDRQHLDEVQEIVGILNATSNFILSHRARALLSNSEDASENAALALAVERGLAERPPSADEPTKPNLDLDGSDAASKLAILASIAFQTAIKPSSIALKVGIRNLGQDVFAFARTFDYRIKPLASARKTEAGLELGVYPALVDKTHPLASIDDDLNAILVKGKYSGWHMFSGKGAGPEPTATAMYNDLYRVVRNVKSESRENPLEVHLRVRHLSTREFRRRGYFHAKVPDEPGNLGRMANVLGRSRINIRQFHEAQALPSDPHMPIMLSTDPIPWSVATRALKRMEALPGFREAQFIALADWV